MRIGPVSTASDYLAVVSVSDRLFLNVIPLQVLPDLLPLLFDSQSHLTLLIKRLLPSLLI
jgi:hypothetical protein